MRTRHPASIAILLTLSALVVASCDMGPAPASPAGAAGPADDGTQAPASSPVATPAPATPEPSSGAMLAADVLTANTTPWPVKSVVAGSTICAIDLDDELRCWAGGLEEPPGGAGFVAIDPGPEGPCGIRTGGELTCWGRAETQPPKGRFVALSSAEGWRCAIRVNGEVACWEAYDMGEGPSAPRVPEGKFTQVAVSFWSSCALRVDGRVVCWSPEEDGSRELDGMFIALGRGCGIRDAGELECFEPSVNDVMPVLPDGPFTRLSGSPDAGCALRGDGSLACWGQQGYDAATDEPRPVRAPAGSWADVSVSEYYTCVRAGDGQAACWGIDDEQARPGPAADVRVAEISQLSRVEVSWTGTPLAAPITSFDVEFSHRDPLAPVPETEEPPEPDWTPWLQGTTDRSATFEATGGGTWCFRARAHDADGITGGSLGMGCTSVPLDDRELDAVADWTRVEGPGYSAGTALRATAKGATIRISNGPVSSIGILGTRCGGCGTFLIGGDEVDLKGPFGDSVMVAAGNNGQEGYDGPVDIVVTSSGKPVIIDAIYLDLPTE